MEKNTVNVPEEAECWVGKGDGGRREGLWGWRKAAAGGRAPGWGGRAAAGEALGTALLVLLSCLPRAAATVPRALTAGAVVAALVQSFDHISGAQLNPSVTLAKLVAGYLPWRHAVSQVAAQAVGAALGAALLPAGGASCLTQPAPGVSATQAVCVEAVTTAVLALASVAAWHAAAAGAGGGDTWPLRAGSVVAAMVLSADGVTGASMNPARSLGPALCARDFTQLWVYVAGPLGGAAVTAALHRALLPAAPAAV